MRSGLREVHFGQRMRGVPGIARFVDAFESTSKLWLVFMDEGGCPSARHWPDEARRS